MPCRIVGVEALVAPEVTHLVDVAAVLCVGNLVALGGGVDGDVPLLTLRVDDILLGLEYGVVTCAVGVGIHVGEPASVHLYIIASLLDEVGREYLLAVGVLALVFADEVLGVGLDEGAYHLIGYGGIGLLDGAFEVTREDGLLCLLQLQHLFVGGDEAPFITIIKQCMEQHGQLAALADELHHL